MKRTLIVGLLFLNISCLKAQYYSDSISVNFFLLDECRISQNITGEINYITSHFGHPQFNYQGFFPNTSSTVEKIEQFKDDYALTLSCSTDYDKLKTKYYGATIAPEVVVYDEKNQKLIYLGRINDSYAEIGQRRRIVTSNDLRTVLEDVLNQRKIKIEATQAIGCYIN